MNEENMVNHVITHCQLVYLSGISFFVKDAPKQFGTFLLVIGRRSTTLPLMELLLCYLDGKYISKRLWKKHFC